MKNIIQKVFLIFIFVITTTNLSWSQESKNNTIVITERKAVFYTISQVEYDSLVKKEDSEINEILSDFDYYRKPLVLNSRKDHKAPASKLVFLDFSFVKTKFLF